MPLNKETKPNQTKPENSEFKPALFHLKIDPVSHLTHGIYIYKELKSDSMKKSRKKNKKSKILWIHYES